MFDTAVFDELTEAVGVTTETDKAALMGVDRVTLYRYRTRELNASLDVATRTAERLGTTVERLWPRKVAA